MSSNSDDRALERRLAAVERAVDGREREASNATDPTDTTSPDRESLEERLETLESRVDELDAALQAVRGFLGGIDAVNEAVESRADAAIAAVDRLERRLDEMRGESSQRELHDQPGRFDAWSESDIDEWSNDRSCGTVKGHGESSPETGERNTDEGPHGDETANDADRTLRERLSEQW